jgi:hypothetical protein
VKTATQIPEFDNMVLDLGKDVERMTDADAERQHTPVNRLLAAFFGPLNERREIQLLSRRGGLGQNSSLSAWPMPFLVDIGRRHQTTIPDSFIHEYRALTASLFDQLLRPTIGVKADLDLIPLSPVGKDRRTFLV